MRQVIMMQSILLRRPQQRSTTLTNCTVRSFAGGFQGPGSRGTGRDGGGR